MINVNSHSSWLEKLYMYDRLGSIPYIIKENAVMPKRCQTTSTILITRFLCVFIIYQIQV